MDFSRFNRRQFLRTAALGATASAGLPGAVPRPVAIVLDPADPVAARRRSRYRIGRIEHDGYRAGDCARETGGSGRAESGCAKKLPAVEAGEIHIGTRF